MDKDIGDWMPSSAWLQVRVIVPVMQWGYARIHSLGQPGKSNHGFAFMNVEGEALTASRQHILESAVLVTFQT